MIYTWNVQIDDLFHLPFSDLRSDQYSSCRCEIKPKITPKCPGFHPDSMTIGPIANRRTGDERGHETAYFTYRLCHDTIRTQILNLSKKCWLVRSGFCVETSCNGPVPGRKRTRNRTAHLDLLLTLVVIPTQYKDLHGWAYCVDGFIRIVKQTNKIHNVPVGAIWAGTFGAGECWIVRHGFCMTGK